MSRTSLLLIPLLGGLLTACGDPEPSYGQYDFSAINSEGVEQIFQSESGARCGINTSYPDGNPEKGKFYVSVIGDNGSVLSLTAHWLDFEEAPPAGSYPVSETVTLTVTLDDETLDSSAGTIVLSDEGEGLRMDFNGVANLNGDLLCQP